VLQALGEHSRASARREEARAILDRLEAPVSL
jgi:hypothetical protein